MPSALATKRRVETLLCALTGAAGPALMAALARSAAALAAGSMPACGVGGREPDVSVFVPPSLFGVPVDAASGQKAYSLARAGGTQAQNIAIMNTTVRRSTEALVIPRRESGGRRSDIAKPWE